MADNQKKFYLTTAIVYASGKPHIGNTYEIILTDAIARYKRQRGYDVFFLTGTDEHGQKIEERAKAAGITPKQYVDRVTDGIKDIWNGMHTTYDHFIRTTDVSHEKAVARIFQKLYDQGDIYKNEYEGWYCLPCESFFTDTQIVDGKCPDCGRPVTRTKEEAYFFRTGKYTKQLLAYMETHPDFIEPEARKKEMINNFLKPGLQDLCVSRTSFKWGIPVPFDPKHVIYVWVDALFNYITALGYDVDEQGELYQKYWPADVHIIGKDIMRFHAIYWPIFLMALGLPLPKKIFGHPWLQLGNDKMSKSKGNVIYADELAEVFGVDGVRHYVLSEMPYAADGSITYETVISRYNTDLANNLGNLVNRTMAMTKKYFDGVIPAPTQPAAPDDDLRATVEHAKQILDDCMDTYHIADAVDAVFGIFRRANKYIDETTPWVLAKDETNRARLGTVMYNLLETIRVGAILLTPFLPDAAESILSQLQTDARTADFGALKAGQSIGEAKALFPRIDEEKVLADWNAKVAQRAAEAAAANAPVQAEKPEGVAQIGIDDFMKVELRTAQVIACEPVPRAKKLLKLQLDLGYEKRQVVSGIAKYYQPADLIGKKLIVVANLAPATLCGVESNGMILASGEDTVRVVFLSPDTPLGERVR